MSNSNQHTVCIIGGGMSGLFTGALLAKNGYKVTVLEKNAIIGGGLQSFRRGDAVFNTGMQVFTGYEKEMITYNFFKYLKIIDKLKILSADSKAQEIVWLDRNHSYRLPKGRQAYEEYLIKNFPHESEGIKDLIKEVFKIGHTYDYLFLNKIQRHEENVRYAYMSAYEFMSQYIKDKTLLSLFAYIGGTSGHSMETMPALEFCMMLTLYITDSHRFVGGSMQLVDVLVEIINQNNGVVINNTKVCKIMINDRNLSSVYSEDGRRWEGECFVWACSPKILLSISEEKIFRPSMMERINKYINPFTGYIINCKLKDKKFPFINSSVYISKPSADAHFPPIAFLFTQPLGENQIWAQTMDIYIPATFAGVRKWAGTIVEHRGDNYNKMKLKIANEAIELVSKYYPKIKDAIDTFYVASPLTIRDYYGNPDGAVYGQQGLYVPIKTRVKNLFMTGQAVQNQGVAGIATTSIIVAETILQKSLIEEIAKA